MQKPMTTYLLLFSLLFFLSCSRDNKNSSPIVASAGNARLHLDELRGSIPKDPAFLISSVQVQNFIQHWAEEELVYQKSLSEGFDKQPAIQKKIKDLEKKYIVAEYLQEKVDNSITVSDDEINAYYETNSGEFIRPNALYNVMILIVDSYAKANELRRKALSGEPFENLARENSLDESREKDGKLGWVMLEDLPPEIARRVKVMSPNTTSRPIKTVVGYYIIRLIDVRKKGDVQSLSEASELIKYRIKARKREERYRQLINQLKESSSMTIDWSFIDSLNVIK